MRHTIVTVPFLLLAATVAGAQGKPRENDLKLPIGGTPGPLDAITDVAGVEVGHTTLISGNGKLVVGRGPVRTGVTVVHPRGKDNADPVFAAWFTLNGNGEMTGTTWVQRIATRVSLGVGRQGGFGGNGSGDIFIAFSTANPRAWSSDSTTSVQMLTNDRISPLFQATAQATEAAITNALLAAETTTGINDYRVYAMPVDRMLQAMRKYGRLP